MAGFQPKQFENQDNPEAHYLTTGVEILRQLPDVTDFVAGVGSGGTLMGTARRLKADHAVRAVAVEPDAVPLLSGGTVKGAHHIEGIGDDFIPAVVDQTLVDGVMDINDLDAIAMAAKFGRVLGLGVGISSGANFLGSVIQNLEPAGRWPLSLPMTARNISPPCSPILRRKRRICGAPALSCWITSRWKLCNLRFLCSFSLRSL